MNTRNKVVVLIMLAALLLSAVAVMADAPTYTEEWDGRGSDSLRCDKLGESPERTEAGWIHWIFSTKGDSTNAELVLGGTGSGTYAPGEPLNAETWHFYTPFFELEGLEATIYLFGGEPGTGGGLVISDYCPGVFQEELTVNKTAVTSFTREHFWDIDKKVETENGHEHDGYPKIWLYTDGSGDETATWTVDVTYEGYEDSGWNVSGVITIENTGDLDAVILSVNDVLAGTPITVDCGVAFPYELPVGQTLICTYDEDVDGEVAGFNEVTVTTERDEYFASAPLIWGAPTTEINATVNVKDISGLFGEVDLGTVTAPNGDTFTYTKDFAWADYGADACGDYRYDNTATILETGQSADATLLVNVQCFIYESAWAEGNPNVPFCDYFSNWGWTNPILPGNYEWPLWAGAGQCDTSKGTLVGSVSVVYNGGGFVTVTFNVDPDYDLQETQVYADYDQFPKTRQGRDTVAPGQYYNASPFDGSEVFVIAHAVVGFPDPDFGP